MRKFLFSVLFIFLFISTPALFAQETPVQEYGLSQNDPILVGGENLREGPVYERAYLDKLTGPDGEKVSYTRVGSCCEFETPNGILGGGLLDMFDVTYEGLEEPVKLYLNMYDPHPGDLKAPEGFKLKIDQEK